MLVGGVAWMLVGCHAPALPATPGVRQTPALQGPSRTA